MNAAFGAPPCAPPDARPKRPRVQLPSSACDCHVHICGPQSSYPYDRERIYTPPDALLGDYLHVASTLGIDRVVFVQPSVYGRNNAALLDALARCPLPCRGVAVLDESVTRRELSELTEVGVRGVRFNWVDVVGRPPAPSPDTIKAFAQRLAPFGWHAEFLLHVDAYPRIEEVLRDFPIDVVIAHMGYLRSSSAVDDPGFQGLRQLLSRGRCWVKLSAPYRLCTDVGYQKATSLAKALVGEAPERVVWGSDWPHVMVTVPMPNDGDLSDLLATWVPDPRVRSQVLVENPKVLYGF